MSDLADALAFDGRLASVEDEAAFVQGVRARLPLAMPLE